MTTWEYCKQFNLTLREVSEETGQSKQMLDNWHKSPKKKRLLELVIKGLLSEKGENNASS